MPRGRHPWQWYGTAKMPNTAARYSRAVLLKGDIALDLYLHIAVSGGRSQPTYTVPPDFAVVEAWLSLAARPLAEQARIRKEQWFNENAVLHEAFSAWPLAESQAGYPVLDTVDIAYRRIREAAVEEVTSEPHGLRVQFTLIKSKSEREEGRHLQCTAAVAKSGGKTRGPVGNWMRRDFSPPGAARTLAADLRRLIEEKAPSYQRILCRATHIVQRAALDKDWANVSQELRSQNLGTVEESSWQYGRSFQYLIAKNAVTAAGGQPMALLVKISTRRRTAGDAPTRETIFEAYALLAANVERPYARAVGDAQFGKDSAIQKALLEKVMAKYKCDKVEN